MNILGKEVEAMVKEIIDIDDNRPVVNGILLKDGYAIATDTRILVYMPLPKEKDEDVPDLLRNKDETPGTKMWVSGKTVLKAFKNVFKSALPLIHNRVFVRQENDKTILATTDLEQTVEVKDVNSDAGQYPDVDSVTGIIKGVYSITIGAKYLEKLSKIVLNSGLTKETTGVNFIFEEDRDKGIKFWFRTNNGIATGVVMPHNAGTLEQNTKIYTDKKEE